MPPRRLSLARSDMIRFFDGLSIRVFRKSDMTRILSEKRHDWRLAQYTNLEDFITYLSEETFLRFTELGFPKKPTTLYYWRETSPQELALTLGPPGKTYLAYYTAMVLQELTEQSPKIIYVCTEQTSRGSNAGVVLTQAMVDESFSKPPRTSNQVAPFWGNWRVCVVSSAPSDGLGVVSMDYGQAPSPLSLTGLERTLIDIAVRPHYAGGEFEVLKAYANAAPQLSVNRLRATLLQLEYMYPFHQIIGFYLEAAGVPRERLRPLSDLPMRLEMPLFHGASRDEFSSFWKVWYPQGFAKL